jgi:Ca2+:H+ antiporter
VNLIKYLRQNPLDLLFLAVLLAILAEFAGWDPVAVFVLSALGVIPLARYIGESTEALAHYTGPRLGGLLNATLGNAAELIITVVAIQKGLLELVKASVTGSILGNLLLVLGMAMLFGGARNGVQSFDRKSASRNSILLVLTVLILLVPSLFSHYIALGSLPGIEAESLQVGPEVGTSGDNINPKVEALSIGVAGVMIILYGLGLFYNFRSADNSLVPETGHGGEIPLPTWPLKTALIVLTLSTVGVVYLSELLVGAVEPVVESLGISEFFVGIILIPIIGNVAEHLVAVQVAVRNKMTLSVEIAVSSSLQVALFVAPVLVFISLLLGHPLTLVFNQFELLALAAGVFIAAIVAADGESNWFEGVELLAIYIILGLAFFLLPTMSG